MRQVEVVMHQAMAVAHHDLITAITGQVIVQVQDMVGQVMVIAPVMEGLITDRIIAITIFTGPF